VSGGDTVFDRTIFHSETHGNPMAQRRTLQMEPVLDLPAAPVLTETLLYMDLMVHKSCVDLRDLSQVVLADMGATLQILRAAGREHGVSEGRPWRMEDCISNLGLDACREAISTQTVPRDHRQNPIAEFWAHAREVAHYSKALAEEISDVNPDEAYLAGLLHGIGFLPELLGWKESGVADGALAGLRLAKRWSLPPCVIEFFSEVQLTGYSTRWPGIVRKAHQNAKRPSVHCLFELTMRPQLHRHG
jgi:hypothetical protein